MTEIKRPKVGLGVILMDYSNDKVLLGKRKNAHGDGTWSFPGGHIEWMESLRDCAERELREETGLNLSSYRFEDVDACAVTNDFFKNENKHYITLYLRAEHIYDEPKIMEPKKCAEWKWYSWEKLPELNLFTPVRNLIKQGYNPFR